MKASTNTIATVLCTAFLVSACGTPPHKRLNQGTGPTMEQILQGQTDHTEDRDLMDGMMREHLLASENAAQRLFPRYENYTREALTEINQLFPRHRNPTIAVYVHPHLSTRQNAPVPGYTTAITLFKSNEYALPAELPPAYLPRQVPANRLAAPSIDSSLYPTQDR